MGAATVPVAASTHAEAKEAGAGEEVGKVA
jgi:hypothetical protein